MEDVRLAVRRPVAMADHGMVAAAHPLASATGLEVLMRGGSAMDAAVATAAALNVTLPGSCGLGGDAFILYYDAKTRKVTGINGSGVVPFHPARSGDRRAAGWIGCAGERGWHSATKGGRSDGKRKSKVKSQKWRRGRRRRGAGLRDES